MPKVVVTCQECGKKFEIYQSKYERGRGKYCSKVCQNKARKGRNNPSWARIKKKCEVCGKEFEIRRYKDKIGLGRYCSSKCYGKAISRIKGENHPLWKPKIKKICEECGKEFEITEGATSVKKGMAKYCSRECYGKAASGIYVGEKSHRWKPKIKMNCKECGKLFEAYPYDIDRKYCSSKCANSAFARIYIGENAPRWAGGKIKMTCTECGKEFELSTAHIKNGEGKYCSRDCAGKGQSKIRVGENAANWRGGLSFEPYCPKFNNQFRERVRKWFNFQCVECGQLESKRKLTVHHVYYNKKACCEQNENGEYIYNIDGEQVKVKGNPNKFVALCLSCHTRTNGNRIQWAKHFEDIINNWYQGQSWVD